MRDEHGLTMMQRKAVDFYFETNGNQEKALLLAGYSAKTARGNPACVFGKAHVRAYLEKEQRRLAEYGEISREKVIEELKLLAFARLGDIIDSRGYITEEAMAELTDEQKAALESYVVETYQEGRGDDAREVKRIKVKFGNKMGALQQLVRILGLNQDKLKVEHSVSITDRIQKGRARIAKQAVDLEKDNDYKVIDQ